MALVDARYPVAVSSAGLVETPPGTRWLVATGSGWREVLLLWVCSLQRGRLRGKQPGAQATAVITYGPGGIALVEDLRNENLLAWPPATPTEQEEIAQA